MDLEAAYGDTSGDTEMLALAEEAGLQGVSKQAFGRAGPVKHAGPGCALDAIEPLLAQVRARPA